MDYLVQVLVSNRNGDVEMAADKREIVVAKDLSKTFSNGTVQQHVLNKTFLKLSVK